MNRPLTAAAVLAVAAPLVLLAGPSLAAPPAGQGTGVRLVTTLSGSAEVPGPGDPDGTGRAVVRINPGHGRLCFTLTVTGIASPTAAHVHVGAASVAGPVVVPLAPPTSGSSSGCVSITRTLARDIVSDPAGYYVNVHNATYPAGAARGQLHH